MVPFFQYKQTVLQSVLGSGRGKRYDYTHFKAAPFLGVCVYVGSSDCVSGRDGLNLVNCFSLTSCSEGCGTKRKREARASIAEVGSAAAWGREKQGKAQEEIRSQMSMLTAVFLGSSMAQMFESRAEGKRGLCKSGKGRSACFFLSGLEVASAWMLDMWAFQV